VSLFEFLFFVYLIAAMIWYGGALTGVLLGGQIRRSGDAQAFARFCGAFAQVAGPLFGGAAVVVLATGAWMVALDGGPAFSDLWVMLVLGGWLVAMILGATAVGLSWTKVANALQQPGATIESVQGLVTRAVAFSWLDLAIRTAVVFVMVWQPG
jgi:hypothetical protein